jgi:formylglycine-generating enzyme required for sulfatase activity
MGTREADIPALLKKYGGERAWYEWETPQHEEKSITQPYLISRYPVTNAQFQAFVDDPQGYRHNRWWTKAGLQWRGKRTEPRKEGGVYDLPNHPVVMVTWYEAVAFCNWLTERLAIADWRLPIWDREQLRIVDIEDYTTRSPQSAIPLKSAIENRKFVVRLPTEAEWEKAASWAEEQGSQGARGKTRLWPWGDEFDAGKCNIYDTGIGSTCAVGLFPGGDSPYGCADMAGNVWEWCQSKWVENYKNYDQGIKERESLEGEALRVLRGGSFNDDQGLVRCACRLRQS